MTHDPPIDRPRNRSWRVGIVIARPHVEAWELRAIESLLAVPDVTAAWLTADESEPSAPPTWHWSIFRRLRGFDRQPAPLSSATSCLRCRDQPGPSRPWMSCCFCSPGSRGSAGPSWPAKAPVFSIRRRGRPGCRLPRNGCRCADHCRDPVPGPGRWQPAGPAQGLLKTWLHSYAAQPR